MALETITTRTCVMQLKADGIIYHDYFPDTYDTLADAQEHLAAIVKLSPDRRRPLLIDIRPMRGIERAARGYYSGQEYARSATAAALLVGSPVTQVMANFFIGFNQPPLPTKLFTSETEAVAWLKNFME